MRKQITKCEDCGKEMKKHRFDKIGRFLCFNCYRKTIHIMPSTNDKKNEN